METSFERELEVLIRARYPLLYVVTPEEGRAEELVRLIANRLQKRLHTWTLTRGYEPPLPLPPESERRERLSPDIEALTLLFRPYENAILLLKDFHPLSERCARNPPAARPFTPPALIGTHPHPP
jgi:hypothetical protein